MNGGIHEVWAVTLNPTSIFKITDSRDEHGWPIVECFGARGKSKYPPKSRMRNGSLVGLTKFGILLYCDPFFYPASDGFHANTPPEEAGAGYIGGSTGPVVGLFPSYKNAMECFHSTGLKAFDHRWKMDTLQILKEIGDEHPIFVISKHPAYTFRED